MWMAGVTPVPEQSLPARRNPPKQAAILQLGVFLKMNAIHKHSLNISRHFNRAILRCGPNPRGCGRGVHYVSTWAQANQPEQALSIPAGQFVGGSRVAANPPA